MTTSKTREALMGATDIVAYYYGEKTVCPECTKDLAAPYYLIDSPDSFSTEQVLDMAATQSWPTST
jgi:protein-arginine kinase activator protein McsA